MHQTFRAFDFSVGLLASLLSHHSVLEVFAVGPVTCTGMHRVEMVYVQSMKLHTVQWECQDDRYELHCPDLRRWV